MTVYWEGFTPQSLNFAMPVEWIGEVKPGRKLVAEGHSQTEWLKRTIALEKMKDWQGLLDWCRKWTKNEPKNAIAWSGLGIAYSYLNRYDDAIEAYRQALRIDPEYASIWYNLGYAYGKLSNATMTPSRLIARPYGSIRSMPRHGSTSETLTANSNATMTPSRPIARPCGSIRRIPTPGTTSGPLTNPSSATTTPSLPIAKPLHINPENAKAWYILGLTYALSGNRTAALNTVRELRRLDPARADVLFNVIVPR